MKKCGGGTKRAIPRQGSAELPPLAEELFESAKSQEFVRICKEFGTPCPLRAGGGGSLGSGVPKRVIIYLYISISMKLAVSLRV